MKNESFYQRQHIRPSALKGAWPVIILVLIIIFSLAAVFNYSSPPTAQPDVVLPSGEVVHCYSYVKHGRAHYIYTSDDRKVKTDNYREGKMARSEASIEK